VVCIFVVVGAAVLVAVESEVWPLEVGLIGHLPLVQILQRRPPTLLGNDGLVVGAPERLHILESGFEPVF